LDTLPVDVNTSSSAIADRPRCRVS